MDDYHDERSFLCGYRRCRGYGSTNDLNSPSTSTLKYSELVRHEVSPQDTLRGIVVRYSSNMRHAAGGHAEDATEAQRDAWREETRTAQGHRVDEGDLRRIDSNMKVTKKQVRRMEKSFDAAD
ncbi:hypothetical protein QR680_007919 [Steinernema hermaphroditum]|uniref:Uncharacterized protein n=1 Tax=Steinernema hermaphroditum TaxID=289476 RepID=A0AA39M6Q3_9BILA|nr:hypothetical protein QR680_007919 [Steinernema hermaphroditum]